MNNELIKLWPQIPQWAKDKILQIATISVKPERWRMVVPPKGRFGDRIRGKYLVSNLGRLKRVSTGKIVNQYKYAVSARPVHRMVAETWVAGQSKEKYIVMHLDGDGTNNWVGNLKWGTAQDNIS